MNFEIELIRLIVEFLFGNIIDLNGNTEALNCRLVCKKFREEIDRLAHLSIILPIKKRRNFHPPSKISSIYMFNRIITEQDWNNVFGDELSNLESSLEHLHVSAYSVKYLPKFKYLKSILWEVVIGCYDLLKEIPHNELIITRYLPWVGSIAHLTRLREIEIIIGSSDHKLIDKHLPSTVLHMTINMYSNVADVIDLSKFTSLEYLEIEACYEFRECLIDELILPPRVCELYSSVKIEKINLHDCEDLRVLELKK